ncbi:MAG: hypothetical protein JJ863_11615 [Deltaproteobacteria bacterium]|nr:hypothetical protein [Deltaproteobacteria bacterium]
MRRLLPLLLLALLSCGDGSTFETFMVRARAPSGMDGAGVAIVPGAVDRIDVVIDPADNVSFDPVNYPVFEDGDVTVRITPAGEYVLALQQGWIERNMEMTETTWIIDVPMYVDGTQELPLSGDPTIRIFFVQFGALGEETIGEASRGLPWPPEPGSTLTIPLTCRIGYETECQTPTP